MSSGQPGPAPDWAAIVHDTPSGGPDGLDDYSGDYRSFTPLGPEVLTAELRHQLERRLSHLAPRGEGELPALEPEAWEGGHPQAGLEQASSGLHGREAVAFSAGIEPLLPFLRVETLEGRARRVALDSLSGPDPVAGPVVLYRSAGRLLITGPAEECLAAASRLRRQLHCTVLTPEAAAPAPLDEVAWRRGSLAGLAGHLGSFRASLAGSGSAPSAKGSSAEVCFDLVLDLARPPLLRSELLPLGYYAPAGDAAGLERALLELPELIGELEKPRFFDYRPSLCAHGRSRQAGCTRCLEACSAAAIRSHGDAVEVDPYLCQGCGICATVCPTGAMGYLQPSPRQLLGAVRTLLKQYRAAGGERPAIAFLGGEQGLRRFGGIAPRLPESLIPVAVAELGALGLEAWTATLAYGAAGVLLFAGPDLLASVREQLERELGYCEAILAGMGYAHGTVRLVVSQEAEEGVRTLEGWPPGPAVEPASFAPLNEKRQMLRLALERLHAQAPDPRACVTLPPGAPFGRIVLDLEACTLCMACVSVCPAGALGAGEEIPQLRFLEGNCVQCGLCRNACPERAIELEPRMAYTPARYLAWEVLKEEPPCQCLVCGKPFASRSLVERISAKLAGHWMFQTDEARRRLQMCELCRVRDIALRGGRLEVHRARGPGGARG